MKVGYKVKAIFSSILFNAGNILCAINIQNDIYNLRNKTDTSNDTFCSDNMGTTYAFWGKTFTQNYSNGTLIIGNTSKNPNANNNHWFGSAGNVGFINANFNAKEVYITGTLGSGNSFRTGGGANITFNASNNLQLDNANISINRAGTQNETTTLNGKTIYIKDSQFNIENINSGGINIGNENTENITIDNANIKMEGGQINVIAKSSSLNFGAINITNGILDLTKSNYTQFRADSINMTDSKFQSKELNIGGDIVNGRFITPKSLALASFRQSFGSAGQDFTADSVTISDDTSTLQANNATIKELNFNGPSVLWGSASKKLTATLDGNLTIDKLTNPYKPFGKGFSAELQVNKAKEVIIKTISPCTDSIFTVPLLPAIPSVVKCILSMSNLLSALTLNTLPPV